MNTTSKFQEIFYCVAVAEVEHGGETYFVTNGTGDGVFAYTESAFEAGVEAASEASEEHYTAFCDHADPETSHEVARAVHRATGLSICHNGTCDPVLDFVDVDDKLADCDFEEDGFAFVRNHGLYAKLAAGSSELYLGPVSDEQDAEEAIEDFLLSLDD